MKPNLYICHTAYQVLVDLLRAGRAEGKPHTMVLSAAVADAEALCRRLDGTGVVRTVLVDESWNLSALERRGLAGFQTDRRGMAAMLDGKITAVTSTAAQNGIYIGMSGREALLKVMYEKEKNGQS